MRVKRRQAAANLPVEILGREPAVVTPEDFSSRRVEHKPGQVSDMITIGEPAACVLDDGRVKPCRNRGERLPRFVWRRLGREFVNRHRGRPALPPRQDSIAVERCEMLDSSALPPTHTAKNNNRCGWVPPRTTVCCFGPMAVKFTLSSNSAALPVAVKLGWMRGRRDAPVASGQFRPPAIPPDCRQRGSSSGWYRWYARVHSRR